MQPIRRLGAVRCPAVNLTRTTLSKVPEVTALFWLTKLLTTAVGESTSDYLVKRMNPVVAVGIGGLVLIGALVLQFRADRYVPWTYWFTVVMVAIVGTMAADVLHIQFHVPYAVSTAFFAVVLTVVFVTWSRVEGTLSIHSIVTPRREAFYWAAVMATFALGTAAGDLTATTLGLGYLSSAVLFAALITVPAVGFWRFHLNAVLAFWSAYVLTRPLGASIADWLGKPKRLSGLGWGDGIVSVALAGLIVACVAVLARAERRRDPVTLRTD
jgi:uncharacterized membrane-anchored protein